MKKLFAILLLSAACTAPSLWANTLSIEFITFLTDKLNLHVDRNNKTVDYAMGTFNSFEYNPTQENLDLAKAAIGVVCNSLKITRNYLTTDGTGESYDGYTNEGVLDRFEWLMRRLETIYRANHEQ